MAASLPWVERHRPHNLRDMQEPVRGVDGRCNVHCLFYGPPGTGKTTAAMALARQVHPDPATFRQRVLELNASHERGVQAVRTVIKSFAHQSVRKGDVKIVILDEADSLTPEAQHALRRIMEETSMHTRFFVLCNYVTRILPAIVSRCARFGFRPLSDAAQRACLRRIATMEGVTLENDVETAIVECCHGDMRRAITLLQTLHETGLRATPEDVRELAGQPLASAVETLFDVMVTPSSADHCLRAAQRWLSEGYSAAEAARACVSMAVSQGHPRAAWCVETLSKCDSRIAEGADPLLQLADALVTCQRG